MEGQEGGTRFNDLVHALYQITRLQKLAVNAQIDAREKRRKAGFKRRDVWICDANFMKELQKLIAKEHLKGFEKLQKLALDCQEARGDLGPWEDESTKAEQLSEGEMWRLQQAEDLLYDKFSSEIQFAESYSSGPSSTSSDPYQARYDESQSIEELTEHPHEVLYGKSTSTPSSGHIAESPTEALNMSGDSSQDMMLLCVQGRVELVNSGPDSESENGDIDLDPEIRFQIHSSAVSGHGNIDLPLRLWTKGDLLPLPEPPPSPYRASLERYPALLSTFGTIRERIDKWILNSLLLSHLEATVLRDQLTLQITEPPSDWAQLVLAYWELDDAGRPTK
jgi:hypothetical protein